LIHVNWKSDDTTERAEPSFLPERDGLLREFLLALTFDSELIVTRDIDFHVLMLQTWQLGFNVNGFGVSPNIDGRIGGGNSRLVSSLRPVIV
jgi:hypothetical protein